MLRSAAVESTRAVLKLVVASSRPSILHRPIVRASPAIPCPALLLPSDPVHRFPSDFCRGYGRGRVVSSEDEEDEDEDDYSGDDFEDDMDDEFDDMGEDGDMEDRLSDDE